MKALTSPILIVEDSETQALQLRYLLEEQGWEVVRASTAESALEELNRCQPSLIIADYHLPGIRGDELCRRVRMNVGTRGIPILMLTIEEAQGSERAGLDSGADDYVSKAVPPEILLVRVRALLRASGGGTAAVVSQDSQFHRARLLAIDDSPTYLECLAEALHGEGYEVSKASCGKEALDRITRESFDCVVVDLVMPDLDGIEVCRRINDLARSQGRSMSVVMLTACETKEDMTRGLEAGADDFVGKSSDMTVLKARIRALLRRKFFQEENRRIREELMHKELEATEARAAKELAETKAALVEELERKNKELEAFSYSVSHDLRAPLRSIDGFSSALLEDHAGKLDAKGQDYLRRVRAATQRMGELIDDLLQLSKVGRAELQRRPVDLSVMARHVAQCLQQSSPDRHVKVTIEEGITAHADYRLLQVVLENLLGNAWKFTSRIDDAHIEVGTADREGVPSFFVRDNGAGFDMAYAEKLFAPFQRLHSEARFPGTGIGLATVYRVVERHGGRIWGEGVIDHGATFSWTMPAAGETRIMPKEHVILLVEDNPDDVELTIRAFERSNIANEIVKACDGQEALDYLFATGAHAGRDIARMPHVVLLDLNLPKINGLEVLRRMRADERTRRIPVVVLTTSNEERDVIGSYDLGANSYVRKPVDFAQFLDAARHLGLYWLVLNEPPPPAR